MNELEQCFAKCKRGCTMQYYDCEQEHDPVIDGCQEEEWVAEQEHDPVIDGCQEEE